MSGPLKNQRHEAFAQELAKGQSNVSAYVAAGYSPDRGAASRLSSNVSIRKRVAELKEAAADRTAITIASITDRLLKIAKKAEGKDSAPMLSVARQSLMDAAKLNGLIVDKTAHQVDISNLSDDELAVLERILGKTSNA